MAEMDEPKRSEPAKPDPEKTETSEASETAKPAAASDAAPAAEAAEEAALEAEMAEAVKVAKADKAAADASEPPASAPSRRSVADGEGGIGLLYDIELDATLQFGSKEMLLRDVLELGPGDVVELDRHIAEPVDLVVGDRIVARGEVVVANGNFALRVLEVATPQMRLESIRCLF
jgi:flagellar motor switch protein FliN/FliY